MPLTIVPINLREANDFVENFHRHNGRIQRDGGKFAIAVLDEQGEMWGVGIVARPLARTLDDGLTAEIRRTCVRDGAPRNANSMLLGRCWRIWEQMGGKRMITYTLSSESGASLRGAGFRIMGEAKGRPAGWFSEKYADQWRRTWTPAIGQQKLRWGKP